MKGAFVEEGEKAVGFQKAPLVDIFVHGSRKDPKLFELDSEESSLSLP